MQQSIREIRRQLALQEPRERQCDHRVFRIAGGFDDLIRDSSPERAQASMQSRDTFAAQQVGERDVLPKIQLDLVVPIGAPHGGGFPRLAGKAIRLEVGAAMIEAMHHLRKQKFSVVNQGGSPTRTYGRVVHHKPSAAPKTQGFAGTPQRGGTFCDPRGEALRLRNLSKSVMKSRL